MKKSKGERQRWKYFWKITLDPLNFRHKKDKLYKKYEDKFFNETFTRI